MGITKRGSITLSRAIQKFEQHVENKVKEVIVKTAEIIASQATVLAPVDEGNLKRSIEVIYYDDGLSAKIVVGAAYGLYIEFGTGIYSQDGTGRKTPWVYFKDGRYYFTRGNKPQPFFFPAVEQGAEYFERAMNRLG